MKLVSIFKNVILFMLIIFMTSCSMLGNNVTTESGKELSKAFKSVNLMLEGSKEFYTIALSSAGNAYKEGYLTDEQKNEIITYATTYKKLHNDAVDGIMDWYDAVENNDENLTQVRENAIKFLFDMTETGKELNRLLTKYGGEKLEIAKKYVPTFFTMLESLEPILSGGR